MRLLSILSLIVLLLAGACSSKKKQAELLEQTKPTWLKERPVSTSFFYGIGTTPKVGGEVYYKEKAKEKALSDLAKQISTTIKSEQNLYRMEDNKGVYEYFQSRVKATSNEFLEGYQYVDQWEDLSNYYTFYRLSKSEFYALKAKRKEDAMKLAYLKYKQAQEAQQQKDIILALEQYAAAIDAISGYLNEEASIETETGKIDLYEVNKDALSDLVNSFKLNADTPSIEVTPNSSVKGGQLQLALTCGGYPVKNIPVRFNYSGGFLVNDKMKSDEDGIILTPAFDFGSQAKETLKANVDLKELSRQVTRNLIVRQLITHQSQAAMSITVEASK